MKCGTECIFWSPPSEFQDANGEIIRGWTAKCLVGFCYIESVNGGFMREDICMVGDNCYLPAEYEAETNGTRRAE